MENFEGDSFDFSADQWSSRIMTSLKLPGDWDVELTGRYESERETFQSIEQDFAWMDIGMRKKLKKGKTIVSFSIRDAFASRIERSTTTDDNFSVVYPTVRGRFFTLGISYGFGKGEAMEFKGRRRY